MEKPHFCDFSESMTTEIFVENRTEPFSETMRNMNEVN